MGIEGKDKKIQILITYLLIIAAGLLIGSLLKFVNWSALAAIGTISAVIWAIFHQGILGWIRRPILELKFDSRPPWFRKAPEGDGQMGYYVNLELTNTGMRTAKCCQPFISGVGEKTQLGWKKEENWIPVDLQWSFDGELHERDLRPHRPCFFNGGKISTRFSDRFRFSIHVSPNAQEDSLQRIPGEFCYEITVAGEEVNPVKICLHVVWTGGFVNPDMDVAGIISIRRLEKLPWE